MDNYEPSGFFGISKDIIGKLFRFVTSESCFLFNNILYNQIDGVMMGSSLGPLFANAFLCHMEVKWLNECPIHLKPIFYRRYVDDTFLIFESEEANNRFFEYMNSRHRNIKYTCENEENGSIPFLDIDINKTKDGLVTGVYRKPTHTGLGLSWFSFCPQIYKVNSIKTLLDRAYALCSNYFTLHAEIGKLRDFFLQNNFKESLFDDVLKKFLCLKLSKNSRVKYDVPKLVKYIKLPFYGKVSYDFRKAIQKNLSNSFPSINFRIVFVNDYKIGSFFNFKDSVPKPLCSNLVYKFTCPSCKARYIGCTSRSFKIRVFEHIGKSYRSEKFLQKMSFSAIRNHSREMDHAFTDNDFQIIAKFRSQTDAFIGEKLLIQKLKPEINLSNSAEP